MDGIILVDKPKGWTSFDVVAKIRGIIRQTGEVKPKVGHTGTLDPLATGLTIVVVGSYCKRASEFSKLDKTYEVTLKLGETSTTGDEEGEKTAVGNKAPSLEEIKKVLEQFEGEIEQIPPVYSAIKVDGQRAYKLARAGKAVKLDPRSVTFFYIQNVDYDYPYVSFSTRVSSGTYIRSLVEDIGNSLGVGAYMTKLKRTKVGSYELTDAKKLEHFSSDNIKDCLLQK